MTHERAFLMDGSDGPALIGAVCAGCGAAFYPARPACAVCGSLIEDDPVPMGRTARLQRFTISNVAPAGIDAPYVLGVVRLAEGPELVARIVPAFDDWNGLAEGQPLTLSVDATAFHYIADREAEHD